MRNLADDTLFGGRRVTCTQGSLYSFYFRIEMARKTVSFILFLSCCYVAYTCPEGAPCNSTTVPRGLCIRNTCMETIPNWDRENLTFTITVKYPEDTLKVIVSSRLELVI